MVDFLADKILMGGLAVAIMLVAYSLQLWKTWKGAAEPHPIAWFGFGFLTGVGYLVQWQEGAGAGSWVLGLTSVFCLLVGGVSQYKKHWRIKDFNGWDWGSMAAGIGLFALYLSWKDFVWGPLLSVIFVTSADLVLYTPIFRKAWLLPEKEYAPSYGLNSLKYVPSLFALSTYRIETFLYPIAMIVVNAIVVFYLLWRRSIVTPSSR